MSAYQEMDPELALKLIEGYEDVLSSESQQLDALYSSFTCPRCQCGLQKEPDARHAFADSNYCVGRSLLRCPICRYLIDPHSKVVLEYGDASKVPFEPLPILGTEDS